MRFAYASCGSPSLRRRLVWVFECAWTSKPWAIIALSSFHDMPPPPTKSEYTKSVAVNPKSFRMGRAYWLNDR